MMIKSARPGCPSEREEGAFCSMLLLHYKQNMHRVWAICADEPLLTVKYATHVDDYYGRLWVRLSANSNGILLKTTGRLKVISGLI